MDVRQRGIQTLFNLQRGFGFDRFFQLLNKLFFWNYLRHSRLENLQLFLDLIHKFKFILNLLKNQAELLCRSFDFKELPSKMTIYAEGKCEKRLTVWLGAVYLSCGNN